MFAGLLLPLAPKFQQAELIGAWRQAGIEIDGVSSDADRMWGGHFIACEVSRTTATPDGGGVVWCALSNLGKEQMPPH